MDKIGQNQQNLTDCLKKEWMKKRYHRAQRNADLATLTEVGGPFTKPEQVNMFMESSELEEVAKNKRLYIEIRHAKNSSLSLPKSSDIFRLKRKGKNLPSKEYAENLSTYLSKITCTVNMELRDFQEALNNLHKE